MDFGVPGLCDGKFQGLPTYEQKLWEISSGKRTTLVARIVIWSPTGKGHLCKSLIHNQFFRFLGVVPHGYEKVSFVNAIVTHGQGPTLVVDDAAALLAHPPREAKDFFEMVELCTGLGALGCGATYAGWTSKAQNEVQKTFCSHLEKFGGNKIIEGDLCKLATIVKVHEAAPHAGAIAWGFSCQPFSKLGDQQHGNDARAQTLPYGLFASYLLQKDLVVLECVTGAAASGFVQKCLDYHVAMTKFERSETMMDLGSVWPAARKRWWCVLMHGSFGRITFRPFPEISPRPTIHNLLPDWLKLTEQQVAELRLTEHELAMFNSCKPGLVQQIVDKHSQLPTALHSWGNQCQSCKCGCRPAFKETRLKDQGLFGALVVIPNETGPGNIRHLSPQETAMLCGWPKTEGWEDDQRMLLAGIGQLASPIQSAWVFGHIREHIANYGYGDFDPASPSQILACVCMDVFKIRDELYPPKGDTVANAVFREEIEKLLEPPQVMQAICDATPAQMDPIEEEIQTSGDIKDEPIQQTKIDSSGDELDQAILSLVEPNPKRQCIPGAVPGFVRDDFVGKGHRPISTTTVGAPSMNPGLGDSHVSDRWCMNLAPGGLKGAVPQDLLQYQQRQEVNNEEELQVSSTTHSEPRHWTQQPELRSGCCVTPAEIASEKVVVFHRESQIMNAVSFSGQQTIGDLLNAEGIIENHPQRVCFDVLGQHISSNQKLKAGQIVCIGQGSDVASDQCSAQEVSSMIQHQPRWFSVFNQGGRVANDEIQYYLKAVAVHYKVSHVEPLLLSIFDPEQIELWQAQLQKAGKVVVSAILVGDHWTPVVVGQEAGIQSQVHCPSNAKQLVECLFKQAEIYSYLEMPSRFQNDCGFQAFAWLFSVLEGQPKVQALTFEQAVEWRQLFWKQVFATHDSYQMKQVELGGHADELLTALSAMLKEHGVSLDQVQQRAQTLIAKIGATELQNAVVSSRPWQAIKRLANESNPPIRLVHQHELDKVLAEKAKAGKPVGSKRNKQSNYQEYQSVTLGPDNLVVPKGVFAQSDGTALNQIPVRQVSSKASGIVVVNETDVQPFLNSSQISDEGLAFLVLNPSASIQQQAGTLERFPAQCSTSGEPILVSAFMLQRGSKAVVRAKPTQIPKVEEVPVTTVKILIFRDQLAMSWSDFAEAPVKNALKLAPCLQVCRVSECDCELWHPKSDHSQGTEPVLDIWNRDFLNYNFKKTNPKEAVVFACAARVHTQVFEKLSTYSGTGGLYIEPRSSDGRSFHPGFHTVWLSKMTHQEALAARATTDAKVILVRVQHRYGLKVGLEQASQVHSQFRGDTVFLEGNTKVSFTVGPMPWGASRASLAALFKSWDWQAKPIQAIGKSADQRGLLWSVQAMQPPPASVVTMEHGDVLLVRKDPEMAAAKPPPAIEASVFTRKSLQPASNQVPLNHDPWADAAKRLANPASSVAAPSFQQIAQMEKQVEQRVLEKLSSQDKDVAMPDAMDNRVQMLEAQVQQLHEAQNQQKAQTANLTHQVAQVQGKLDQQTHSIQKHMDSKLAEQMNQIEALLNKRSRHE